MARLLGRAALGCSLDAWHPPSWLLPHQMDAARRVAGSLRVFGGSLLADAVGLGKTFVALAVTTQYRRAVAIVPASLMEQWRRVSHRVRAPLNLVSHEALSRGRRVPAADCVIVDEAHRFRNPDTRRYDRLARDLRGAPLLLVTATPVVNRPRDLASLLRLFLPDNGLAVLGVPSIDRAIGERDYAGLAHACAPLVVARSVSVLAPGVRLPEPVDGRVGRPPPLPTGDLAPLLTAIDELEFPGIPAGQGTHLLRAHLLHRLASSSAACRETLRRHLAYLDRAAAAAAAGEPLSRVAARQLLGPGDDLQFDLGLLTGGAAASAIGREAVERERARVLRMLNGLPHGLHPNPKAARLSQFLGARGSARTIVFVGAVATALDLARRLRWRRVAIVGGGRARIASGRTDVDTVLRLFAPKARCAAEPSEITRIDTLVATDLVSEGLDLQDADAIVHYDLPWTPLRLAQRLGRIARLGSEHRTAHVFWFGAPPELDRRLRTSWHLAQKARWQLQLGVPVTSTVGRARVMNVMFEDRERLGRFGSQEPPPNAQEGIQTAVVRGSPAILLAVRWTLPGGICREIIPLVGNSPEPTRDYRATRSLLATLSRSRPGSTEIPEPQLRAGLAVLQLRLQAAAGGAIDGESIHLRRRVLHLAKAAGWRRDHEMVDLLDGVLDRLTTGLTAGPIRELADVLRAGPRSRGLRAWLRRTPTRPASAAECRIDAILAGAIFPQE